MCSSDLISEVPPDCCNMGGLTLFLSEDFKIELETQIFFGQRFCVSGLRKIFWGGTAPQWPKFRPISDLRFSMFGLKWAFFGPKCTKFHSDESVVPPNTFFCTKKFLETH